MQPLARLRLRLTLWYVGIFLSILGLLGGGLFIAVSHRVSRQLDASLRAATSALIQAARVRETEQARATGLVADAVRSEEHTSELQSHSDLVCRLLLEKKKKKKNSKTKHKKDHTT